MYLTQDYQDIIELFNINQVKYIVAGAYSMSVFGYARSTYDIDLWIAKDDENVQKVLNSLQEFGVPFEIEKKDLQKENNVIQIGVIPNRIDILTDIDGVKFDDAWNNKQVRIIDNLNVNVLDIHDIIKNKSSTNRPKDKLDVIELNKLLKEEN
ncbi:MAG: hypothetical protein QG559_1266 [Campylobacterota bacterium]|nr:hypothetical protein [Campylobacterota bacterium]